MQWENIPLVVLEMMYLENTQSQTDVDRVARQQKGCLLLHNQARFIFLRNSWSFLSFHYLAFTLPINSGRFFLFFLAFISSLILDCFPI